MGTASLGGFRVGVYWLPGLGSWDSGCGMVLGGVAMTTTPIASGRELVPVSEPMFTDRERAALAGFLIAVRAVDELAPNLPIRR